MRVEGNLHFYSETGTEGGWYAFQDSKFTHGPDEPCWDKDDKWCPAKMKINGLGPDYVPKHSSYDGLIMLKTGDFLTIYGEDNFVLWDGNVNLRRVDSYGPEGGTAGLRVHEKSVNVDETRWLTWFLKEYRAVLNRN